MNKNIALWILALIIVALAAFNIGRRSVHCKPAVSPEAAACGTPAAAIPPNLPPPPPPSEPNSSHQ